MANPAGESLDGPLRLDFDRRLKLEFLSSEFVPAVFSHDEPIYRNGEKVGGITSGAYGYTLGRAFGLGYVHHLPGAGRAFIADGRYEIEIAAERTPATCSMTPFYDPKHERMRALGAARSLKGD